MRTVEVTRTYLEVKRAGRGGRFGTESSNSMGPSAGGGKFKPARGQPRWGGLHVERAFQCAPSFYRYIYTEIGRANHWTDRLDWSDQRIRTHLGRPDISLWVVSLHGSPAGYFELVRLAEDEYEINYLGLLPDFQGRGLGKHLITAAVQTCWKLGAKRVQLDTSTLDHPAALKNYLKRGFKPYQTERFYRFLPVTEAEERRLRSGTGGFVNMVEYG
ncbi:MAG: GNAT family N-acetyltransferase [Phycisphaerae bacterium]